MTLRRSVLIVDETGEIGGRLTSELRSNGFYTVCIEQTDTILTLLDSNDQIYTIVFVDEGQSTEAVTESIKILKQVGPGVPIIVTASKNDPRKEKSVRERGVFFYHVRGEGMEDLVTAATCAMNDAIRKGRFVPGLLSS